MAEMNNTPQQPAADLLGILQTYTGRRIYFEPLHGNHGDTLILMGARRLADLLDWREQARPEDAEIIVINGGGGYGVKLPGNDFSLFERYFSGFPDKPLIVLPSSFLFEGYDFRKLLERRRAPTLLFARDCYSYDRLQELDLGSLADIYVTNDLALLLKGSEFVEALKAGLSRENLLIVERIDRESHSERPLLLKPPDRLKGMVPAGLKNWLKKRLLWNRTDLPFSSAAMRYCRKAQLLQEGQGVVYRDISPQHNASWDEFLEYISRAYCIVTTRLHVGILGALLGKEVVLVDAMAGYHKLKGVYELSLKPMANVRYVERQALLNGDAEA